MKLTTSDVPLRTLSWWVLPTGVALIAGVVGYAAAGWIRPSIDEDRIVAFCDAQDHGVGPESCERHYTEALCPGFDFHFPDPRPEHCSVGDDVYDRQTWRSS